MRSTELIFCAAAALLPGARVWPGVQAAVVDDQFDKLAELSARQAPAAPDTDDLPGTVSDELIGDLVQPGPTTPVGKIVASIITGAGEDGFSDVAYSGPIPSKGSKDCAADKCCIWSYIANDLKNKFNGGSGRCNGYARASIRMGFHDAGSWSKSSPNGGADGSLILAGEISRPENNGLQKIIAYTLQVYKQYSSYGVGMADLIQFMANTATVVCPLGPRVRTFVGRKDSTTPSPDGLLPSVWADAGDLIKLFEDKTIKSNGLTALIGAHTTSQQQFVDPTRAFDPQDGTPGVWDASWYNVTTLDLSLLPKRIFRFPSDVKLAAHPQIKDEWTEMMDQDEWDGYYSREYVRLSMLGVKNINDLTECTKALPPAKKTYNPPDRAFIQQWLSKGKGTDALGAILENADSLSAGFMAALGIFLRGGN